MQGESIVFKCPKQDCNKQYSNITSLSKHWCRSHKLEKKELYMKLHGLSEEPSCACGCGSEVKFLSAGRGFTEFAHGHASRIPEKNNYVSAEVQEKSRATRRRMWKDGDLQIWNKGLTKQESSSVAEYGKKGSKTITSNAEEVKRRSDRMSQGRLDGTIPTLYGPAHSQWKGGVSSLNHTCRADSRLYKRWIRPHLKRANFTCEDCGAQGRLQVHHDKETFSVIMRKIAKRYNWTKGLTEAIGFEDPSLDELKRKIAKEVTDYHIDNKVSGVVLCKSCHGKHHPNLNTP